MEAVVERGGAEGSAGAAAGVTHAGGADPFGFELFRNAIFAIADEMALTVCRTTYSGVLRDNMDFSTALTDGEGVFRAITVTAPASTITNAVLPAACAARGLTGFRMVDCAFGALAMLLPDKVFCRVRRRQHGHHHRPLRRRA